MSPIMPSQMTREEIAKRIIIIAAEQVAMDPAQVNEQSHFKNDLNYDSLDDVEFAMHLEDEFDVSIPDEQAQEIRIVAQAIEGIMVMLDQQSEK